MMWKDILKISNPFGRDARFNRKMKRTQKEKGVSRAGAELLQRGGVKFAGVIFDSPQTVEAFKDKIKNYSTDFRLETIKQLKQINEIKYMEVSMAAVNQLPEKGSY